MFTIHVNEAAFKFLRTLHICTRNIYIYIYELRYFNDIHKSNNQYTRYTRRGGKFYAKTSMFSRTRIAINPRSQFAKNFLIA